MSRCGLVLPPSHDRTTFLSSRRVCRRQPGPQGMRISKMPPPADLVSPMLPSETRGKRALIRATAAWPRRPRNHRLNVSLSIWLNIPLLQTMAYRFQTDWGSQLRGAILKSIGARSMGRCKFHPDCRVPASRHVPRQFSQPHAVPANETAGASTRCRNLNRATPPLRAGRSCPIQVQR